MIKAMIWGFWLISLPALAYTDAELSALAEREQALIRAPPCRTLRPY